MTKMKDGKIIATELLVDSFKKVVQQKIQLDNGEVIDWIYLDSPEGVSMVALTPENDIILVNQYRPNLRRYVSEMPAGLSEKGETDIEAAKRELLEETGYEAATVVPLGDYYVMPSESNRRAYYFLALDAKKVKEPKPDNLLEEYLELSVTTVPFTEVLTVEDAARHGISGVESLLGIRLANEYLQKNVGCTIVKTY